MGTDLEVTQSHQHKLCPACGVRACKVREPACFLCLRRIPKNLREELRLEIKRTQHEFLAICKPKTRGQPGYQRFIDRFHLQRQMASLPDPIVGPIAIHLHFVTNQSLIYVVTQDVISQLNGHCFMAESQIVELHVRQSPVKSHERVEVIVRSTEKDPSE